MNKNDTKFLSYFWSAAFGWDASDEAYEQHWDRLSAHMDGRRVVKKLKEIDRRPYYTRKDEEVFAAYIAKQTCTQIIQRLIVHRYSLGTVKHT